MHLNMKIVIFAVVVLLASTSIEAKKKKQHKSSSESSKSSKSKTKTKWSTSSYNDEVSSKSIVATEEHGYYVKRTFLPLNDSRGAASTLASPPYLAIPIAWFSCEGDCAKGNSVAINGETNAIKDGFLCDDDCMEPYEPICGKTLREVAVFYNKCKLNVAKCRTHGLWTDLAYDECQKIYPKEVQYAEKKFKSSPYFSDTAMAALLAEKTKPDDEQIETADLDSLHEVSDRIEKAEVNMETEGSGSVAETSTAKSTSNSVNKKSS